MPRTATGAKRSVLLDKLQKIPTSTTDMALVEERKTLMAAFMAFTKPSTSGGPDPRVADCQRDPGGQDAVLRGRNQ